MSRLGHSTSPTPSTRAESVMLVMDSMLHDQIGVTKSDSAGESKKDDPVSKTMGVSLSLLVCVK